MKPYYEQSGVTIYHGDCRAILQELGRVDLVIADPPYGVKKAEWDCYLPLDWMFEAARITDIVAVMPGTSNLLGLPRMVGGMPYRWTLAVHLVNGMTRGVMGFGNWFPCCVYARDGVSLYRPQSDAVDVAIGTEAMPDHPSPKPLNAMKWILGRFTATSVVDPFMGSGTTLVAAKVAGMQAIGIELNERYCEIAAKRLQQEVLPLGETLVIS